MQVEGSRTMQVESGKCKWKAGVLCRELGVHYGAERVEYTSVKVECWSTVQVTGWSTAQVTGWSLYIACRMLEHSKK
jgi:hypothetical protein